MKNSTTSISQRLETDYAEAWRPKPGEAIVGEVVELSSRDGGYGTYPIVVLRTDRGELALHAFHEVLQSELANVAPAIGDTIGIRYAGKDPNKGYHRYRVVREGEDHSFSWTRFRSESATFEADVPVDTDVPVETSDTDDDIPF